MTPDASSHDYPRLSPSLRIDGAADAIAFYASVFGATERLRFAAPDGRVMHAELQIGDAVLMLSDEFPEMHAVGPLRLGGTSVMLSLYVDDVDATMARALEAGASVVSEVTDQFFGDRSGQFDDPFGHRWSIATRVEDVPLEEMQTRLAAMLGHDGSEAQ